MAELSVHIRHSGLLLVAAGAFALLAVTARGPLGLARVCGPRLHATLDIVVAVAVAVAPVIGALRPDITGIAVVEVASLAWVRLATLTRYTRPAEPPVASASSEVPEAPDRAPADAPGPPRPATVVVRGLGFLAGRSGRRLPEVEDTLRGGARQAGRHAARVQRAWRKPPS